MTSILPNELNALISTFLEDEEGDIFRKQAGKIIIKEVRNGKTYGNGLLHSFNDQPAVISSNGTQYWYKNGKLHRDVFYKIGDQPAIIYADGIKCWYQNGELHRDGENPAIIRTDGFKCLYYRGKQIIL